MLRRSSLLIAFLVGAPAGCSSTHDLKRDGFNGFGGGFSDEEIRPGLYKLVAIGNVAPWPSFSAAKGTWQGRADKLCGPGAYQEIVEDQQPGLRGYALTFVQPGVVLSLPRYNTSIRGYVLCNSSGMTREDAIQYLSGLEATAYATELAELGGSNCSSADPQQPSAERLLRRGKLLMSKSEYGPAMQCLLAAQAVERDGEVHREACSSIALMYELGWGVEKDMQTAMSWYKKAGL
jgi:hypothetical protein